MRSSTDRPAALLVTAPISAPQQQCLDRFEQTGLNFDVVKVPRTRTVESVTSEQADWSDALAASATIDAEKQRLLANELNRWHPAVGLLKKELLGRPVIAIGEAATLPLLSVTGSYVAVDVGEEWPARALAFRSAETTLALQLDDAPASESNDAPIVYCPTPLAEESVYAALEAFAALARDYPDIRIDCSGPAPNRAQTEKWVRNLGLNRRLTFEADEPDRPSVLFHSEPEPEMDRTLVLAGAFDAPIVSIHPPKPADQKVIDQHLWLALAKSPPKITEALGASLKHRPVGVTDSPLDSVMLSAWEYFLTPGPSFGSLRQRFRIVTAPDEDAALAEQAARVGPNDKRVNNHLAVLVEAVLPQEGGRIVHVGCGSGTLTARLNDIGYHDIIGVDISPARIRRAKERYSPDLYPSVTFAIAPSDQLPLENNSADAVVISEVLHLLDTATLARTWKEIERVLAPNGALIVREPNRDDAVSRHRAVGTVNLGLRSLVLEAVDKHPLGEPVDRHNPRGFLPAELTSAISKFSEVIDVHTQSPVGYLYNGLTDEDFERVDGLDATLWNQPGHYLFVVSRAGATGVDHQASTKLRILETPQPIEAAHLDTLFDLGAALFPSGPVQGPDINAPAPEVYAHIHSASAPTALENAAASVRDLGSIVVDVEPNAAPQVIESAGHLVVVGSTSFVASDASDDADPGIRILAVRNYVSPADTANAFAAILDDLGDGIGTADQRRRWRQLSGRWQILKASWPKSGDDETSRLGYLASFLPGQ